MLVLLFKRYFWDGHVLPPTISLLPVPDTLRPPSYCLSFLFLSSHMNPSQWRRRATFVPILDIEGVLLPCFLVLHIETYISDKSPMTKDHVLVPYNSLSSYGRKKSQGYSGSSIIVHIPLGPTSSCYLNIRSNLNSFVLCSATFLWLLVIKFTYSCSTSESLSCLSNLEPFIVFQLYWSYSQ